MLEQPARHNRRSSLTGLLLPLSDRCLVLPNVAVAELIGFQAGSPVLASPEWLLGWIDWRGQRLPLLSFESACGGQLQVGERARIVVLNALGSSPLRFVALLVQGIPRSCKLDSQLNYVDVPLAALEMAAVQVGEQVARVPDLPALEQLLVNAGVV
ncbi:chemotaxis protein CheW [Pseudomonas donghuensis]|uniref:Chemotaxis protein CheW n=1 Tax=Pseudomonas donghuensis TaxID=1163398 RepID=A0AAP0SFL8_9PSED|nr:chemotaxis protein CheW [Pseudomonas donghuensis]MDF9891325.1 chemosensory pili system protein ChpC [Pseudomonas vranovensis]KDN99467.1 chemotaxis protein CheW [Pseudomonas donghuensis]MBF4206359.1 chemotaxis protein CheW [Pseudomonas donghuensis]MCP6694870.1 chemotaxis protein CheW [Pseudomonas donghuensis]MCP6696659.1 chemotaxis protein CheW [Pseudomonas donghuensis]